MHFISTKMAGMRFTILVLFVVVLKAIKINAGEELSTSPLSHPKGRLLTPEEGCGHSKVSNTRIVGGTEAKIGAWPWMALLGYIQRPITFTCGGSLITSIHVLTAAHCIKPELSFVRLAEHDTRTTNDGPHTDVLINVAEAHEDWDDKLKINDIGIIHLWQHVTFTARISPICLPFDEDILHRRFVGSNPFLVGWGTTEENAEQPSPVPIQIQIPVVSTTDCKMSYRKIGVITQSAQFDDRVVCAGLTAGGKDSCRGDSGGPLMLPILSSNATFPFYQIGVVSFALGCARPNLPGVNTNVQHYATWINEKLTKLI